MDEEAFYTALASKSANLRRFVESRLPSQIQSTVGVEDIMQAVWISAFESWQTFVPTEPRSLDAWLLRIARNELANSLQHHNAAKRGGGRKHIGFDVESSLSNVFNSVVSPENTPSSELSIQEQRDAVRLAIASLPHREIVWAHEIEGTSIVDIAQTHGKTERAVAGIIHRSKDQLRARLKHAIRIQVIEK